MSGLRELGESAVGALLSRAGRGLGRVQERAGLAYDLLESDSAYLVVLDAPGATMSDVSVRYQEGLLRVRVERFREFREGFEMRFPGRGLSLSADVDLPGPVDAGEASATLTREGTLRVTVPKADGDDAVERVGDDGAREESDGNAAPDDGNEEPTDA